MYNIYMRDIFKNFRVVKGHGEYYFVFGLAIILVIVVFVIVIISLQNNNSTEPPTTISTTQPTAAPTEFPTTNTLTQIPLNPSPIVHTNPSLKNLNIQAASQLVTKEEDRIPLSQNDVDAKNRILQNLPSTQNYGPVYSSNNIDIEYLDLFDAYILTVDVASAKKEAENWFKQEGMSQQGICDLPLGFILDSNTANLLQNTNFVFNPLPDGC